ncbi:MAG: 16S rRNA (cytosine(1402)-N(4))-methyltransferase, partial [Oscillospiraceae bacterium]|nr:16S rRNA (cytosine(1402)-N(4))-methyltransferase [Oscillospiraceae bacterium]
VCGRTPQARLVNRKPITASPEELASNSRSHSAKLRILEKL